jgi:IPT/TIG domain
MMRPPRTLLLLLPLLLLAAAPASGAGAEARTETAWGLHTSTFDTLHGRVVVTVSDDAAAGDTLSGRVRLEPAGDDDATRAANLGRLQGFVVEVETERVPASAGVFRWAVPAAIGAAAAVVLLDQGGSQLGRTSVPLEPASAAGATGFGLPGIGQAGRPVTISGAFDGDLSTSGVTIGGKPATVLAESPRKIVAVVPPDAAGPTPITVTEGETSAGGRMRVVAIRLSAPKLDLKAGETTTLTARFSGLQGLDEPLDVEVETPGGQVSMGGSDHQVVTIDPKSVGRSGEFTWTTGLTGIHPGPYEVTALLPHLARPSSRMGGLCVYHINHKEGECPPAIRDGVEVCVRCPQPGACPRDFTWELVQPPGQHCTGTWTLVGGDCQSACPNSNFFLFKGF